MINNEWKILSYIKKGIKGMIIDNTNLEIVQKQQQGLLSVISKYSLPFDSEMYVSLFEYLIYNKKLNPEQTYSSLNVHSFLIQKGHPGISLELSKISNVYLFSPKKTAQKNQMQNYYFKLMSLSTEKDSISAGINNFHINKLHESSLLNRRIDNKTSRSNISDTIDLIEKDQTPMMNRSRLNQLEKARTMEIQKKEVPNKPHMKVNFIDQLLNKPLASVVLIQSYKKYNQGNRYDDWEDNLLSPSLKSKCCIII